MTNLYVMIDPLTEGDLVSHVGNYVLNYGKPDAYAVGFRIATDEEIREAAGLKDPTYFTVPPREMTPERIDEMLKEALPGWKEVKVTEDTSNGGFIVIKVVFDDDTKIVHKIDTLQFKLEDNGRAAMEYCVNSIRRRRLDEMAQKIEDGE